MPAYLRRTPPSELTATSYADVSSMLTSLGSSYEGQVRLVSKTTGLTIGRWAYVGTAITSIGPVLFDRVTATPTGAAASVAGSVVTVTAPHTLATLSKTLRVQVVTDGTFSDVAAGQWSVSGNDVTVPAATAAAIAAALGAAKSVRLHVEGVSELCIGGSTCALQPGAGATAVFTGAGLSQVDRVVHQWAGVYRAARLRAWLASYTALSATSKRLMIGWTADSTNWSGLGWSRTAAPAVVSSRESGNKTLSTTAAVAVGTYPWIGATQLVGPTAGVNRWYQAADQLAVAAAVHFVDITEAAYAAAKFYTVADDGAVFSRVEIG